MTGFNFTEQVRRILAVSREEAVELGHEYAGTEHMLLGLTREDTGIAIAVLTELGAERPALRGIVLDILKRGERRSDWRQDLPFTTRGKKVLELAMAEARTLRHTYVGAEHLLLGLLAERDGIAAQALNSVGITLERARSETIRQLGTQQPSPPRSSSFLVATPGYARSRRVHAIALVEDFTGRAREVLRVAYEEALARATTHVELEHILLGLALRDDGMASVVLDQLTGGRSRLVDALGARLPERQPDGAHPAPHLSDAAQQALDASLVEASKDGHRRAGTQHVLLAVLESLPLPLAAACAQVGVTEKAARAEYERMRE